MADKRRLDAICTYTGRAIRPLDPKPEDICIEDIAHSLANQCRFTGHTRRFYSVAQHSVHVSQLCENYPLEGLLHDASEAYLSDIARPIKRATMEFSNHYASAEENLMIAIWKKYGLNPADSEDEVMIADNIMLGAEARDLMPSVFSEFGMGKFEEQAKGWPNNIVPWTPDESERIFLRRFYEITDRMDDSDYVTSVSGNSEDS